MSAQRATQQQVDDAYHRAGILLHRGTPPQGVKLVLLRRGWSEAAAEAIIADVIDMLGKSDGPGRRLFRWAWIGLGITVFLAAAGATALMIGKSMGLGEAAGPRVPAPASDAALLILLGCVLLIGAAAANLLTLATAVRARWQARHTSLGPVIVLCICGLAATVYGGFVLVEHFKV